jgi:hypothetical protein
VTLKLLPVPLLLKPDGLLLNPELFVDEPSLLLVLSALDLPLLILALSTYSGRGSVKDGGDIVVAKVGVCCAPGLVARIAAPAVLSSASVLPLFIISVLAHPSHESNINILYYRNKSNLAHH